MTNSSVCDSNRQVSFTPIVLETGGSTFLRRARRHSQGFSLSFNRAPCLLQHGPEGATGVSLVAPPVPHCPPTPKQPYPHHPHTGLVDLHPCNRICQLEVLGHRKRVRSGWGRSRLKLAMRGPPNLPLGAQLKSHGT